MKRIVAGMALVVIALATTPAAASASTPPSSATAAATCPVFDLVGVYNVGGPAQPFILNATDPFTVYMTVFQRPNATGYVVACDTIRVFFPDDNWYTGLLEAPGIIRWQENGTVWRKAAYVPNVIGRFESVATQEIVNAGLVKGTVSRPPSCNPNVINRVRTQFPSPETFADLGTPVNLTIPRMGSNCP